MPDTLQSVAAKRPSLIGHGWLSWPLILGAALLIYELTSDAILVTTICCMKFGWSTIRTAFWCRRKDPYPSRGRTFFWFYLALAAWDIGLFSFILAITVLTAVTLIDPNVQVPPRAFIEAICTMLFTPVLMVVFTTIGCLRGWFLGQRVWIDRGVSHMRHAGEPYFPVSGQADKAGFICLLAAALGTLMSPIVGLVLIKALHRGNRNFSVVVDALCVLTPPILVLCFFSIVVGRVRSRRPGDCLRHEELAAIHGPDA